MLSVERRITESARLRLGTGSGQVSAEVVAKALDSHPHLDLEQRLGVEMLLSSGNGLEVVIGQAGTGKSTMLGAARVGWEEAGYEVIGVAIASRTAAALEASAGIRSSTMARLLMDLGAPGGVGLSARHVVVVEEASMVGSRSLDLVQRYADAAGAKVVLVGDNRQLSSIDAGGALRTLSRELGTQVVELTTNRRQAGGDQAWERDALDRLRNGDIAPAVAAYIEHGRLSFAEDLEMALAQLIEAWWAVHEQSTAILAVARSDVAALNDLARERRGVAGELGPELRLPLGKAFSVGDRVLFEKNERVPALRGPLGADASTLQVRNGTFGTVVSVARPISEPLTREGDVTRVGGDVRGHDPVLVVDLDAGGRVALPQDYVEDFTSLGYALTVFRAQGITVDHAFVLGDESLFQEAAYTAMSRGRLTNHLYATTADDLRSEIGHEARDERRDAMASLLTSLSATKEQTTALDHLHDRHPAGGGLSTPISGGPGDQLVANELSSLGEKLDALQKSLEDLEDSLDRFEPRARVHSAPTWDYDSYDHDVGIDDGFGL